MPTTEHVRLFLLITGLMSILQMSCSPTTLKQRQLRVGGEQEIKSESETNQVDEAYCDQHTCAANHSDVQIAGANLYDNIRARCGFKSPGPAKFDVLCHPVAVQPDSREVLLSPQDLGTNLQLKWGPPVVQSGSTKLLNCTLAANRLDLACQVETTSVDASVTLAFNLDVIDTVAAKQRTETALVSLPYAIGVAFGQVPNSGRTFNPQTGFQLEPFDPVRLLIVPRSVCSDGENIFFTNSNSIWEQKLEEDPKLPVKPDKKPPPVYIYAGGPGQGQTEQEDLTHRLRMRFADARLSIACGKGYVVVSDVAKQRLLKIPRLGKITVIAGDPKGNPGGFSGDGSNGTKADLNLVFPGNGVAISSDPSGDTVYFADSGNVRIRKIDPMGIISTVAGNGEVGSSPDGTLAVEAKIGRPQQLAVTPDGSLFFSMFGVNPAEDMSPPNDFLFFASVRQIKNGRMGTVVGIEHAQQLGEKMYLYGDPIGNPLGLAVGTLPGDPVNQIYLSIGDTKAILQIKNEQVSVFGGDLGERPVTPYAMALDKYNRLLVAQHNLSQYGGAIDAIDTNSVLKTIVGALNSHLEPRVPLPARYIQLEDLNGTAVGPDQSLYVASRRRMIHRIDKQGLALAVAGCVDFLSPACSTVRSPAPNTEKYRIDPSSIAIQADGSVLFTERNTVSRHSKPGIVPSAISTIAGMAGLSPEVTGFFDLDLTVEGDSGDGSPAVGALLKEPQGLAVGPDGSIYIADTGNNRIRRIDGAGIISTVAGSSGETTAAEGDIGDGGPAILASIYGPKSMAISTDLERSGQATVMYFADSQHSRIRRVDESGIISTLIGTDADLAISKDALLTQSRVVTIVGGTPARLTIDDDDFVGNGVQVYLNSSGQLPIGLQRARNYFVIGATRSNRKVTFQLANTLGGAAIGTTGPSWGPHRLTVIHPVSLIAPDQVAAGPNGDVYIVDHPGGGGRLSVVSRVSADETRFRTIFQTNDGSTASECSVGKEINTASSKEDLQNKVQASLAHICRGINITSLAVGHSCESATVSDRTVTILLTQRFSVPDLEGTAIDYFQLTQLQLPCPSL